MEERLDDNLTSNDYYTISFTETTRSAEHILQGDGTRLALCERSQKIVPTFQAYINISLWNYSDYSEIAKEVDDVSIIRISALSLIIIIGLIGNISVILTIALNKSMRNTVNVYIANLAVADFTTCIISGFVFSKFFSNDYMFGEIACKLFHFAFYACLDSSVLSLAAISFDRFMAVVFPLYVRVTKQRKSMVVTIIWIVSMLAGTPHLFIHKIQTWEFADILKRTCVSDWSNQRYYHATLEYCTVYSTFFLGHCLLQNVFLYFIPILIMIAAYSFIFWRLRRTKVPGEQIAANDNVNSKRNMRVHKMIFVVLLVFFICWTPFQIATLYEATIIFDNEYPDWWKTFKWAAWFSYLGNSCMNPIIYAGFKKDFRMGIYAVFRCGKLVVRENPPQNKRNALDCVNKKKTQEPNVEPNMNKTSSC